MKQLWDVYTVEYHSAVKKKKTLPFATVWMDLESIMLREIIQAQKGQHHMISLVWNLMNELD